MPPLQYFPSSASTSSSSSTTAFMDSTHYDIATTSATIHTPSHSQPPSQPISQPSSRHPTRASSPEDQRLPSLQVTHPTPTKAKKFRRGSTEGTSSSGSIHVASPTWRMAMLPSRSPSALSSLEVSVEPLQGAVAGADQPSGSRSRPRSPESDEEEKTEDQILAEKIARTREKGRERQRRKRQRDKEAKEAAARKASGGMPTPLHLSPNPIGSLSITVPSPASSTYSSLHTGSYFSVSPGTAPFFGASLSGESPPSTLFSPSASTPGTGYLDSVGYWSTDGTTGTNTPSLDLGLSTSIPRSIKGKSASVSGPPSTTKISPVTGLPLPTSTSTMGKTAIGPSPPYKRRKSEPQPEAFRAQLHNANLGLGVNMGENAAGAKPVKEERPRVLRTSSDGVVLRSDYQKDWSRSPTPPPVPTLPSEYRKRPEAKRQESLASLGEGVKSLSVRVPTPTPTPNLTPVVDSAASSSSEGASFASFAVSALMKSKDLETKRHLGLGKDELEGMKDGLAQFYDKWTLERGMSRVSLESRQGRMGEAATNQAATPSTVTPGTARQPPASTPHPTPGGTLFFTPSTGTPLRQDVILHGSYPMLQSFSQTLESPLASLSHGRQRSLSSVSVVTRASNAAGVRPGSSYQYFRTQPETPISTPSGNTSAGGQLDSTDDSASPVNSSLQTPSTGQGSFPLPDSLVTYKAHWRSATDPTGVRTYTTFPNQGQVAEMVPSEGWSVPASCPPGGNGLGMAQTSGQGQGLDSPLSMTAQLEAVTMMPPPSTGPSSGGLAQEQHGDAQSTETRRQSLSRTQSQPHPTAPLSVSTQNLFRTPNGRRAAGLRRVQPVPYTPPTPLGVRGQSHGHNSMSMGGTFGGALFYGTGYSPDIPSQTSTPVQLGQLGQQQQQSPVQLMEGYIDFNGTVDPLPSPHTQRQMQQQHAQSHSSHHSLSSLSSLTPISPLTVQPLSQQPPPPSQPSFVPPENQ
ncbi:hypothetical protein IAT38_007568 [Cryptococcus sp. DSM 104549]